ncbi:MAG: hypothetical protein Q8Q76_10100 [Methylotenera sp.]|nr:hypothetical protein [Methylotenera sp.]
MAYVLKNALGAIIASSPTENPDNHWTFIEASDKAYLTFLENALIESDTFRESDIHLARVLEDLITLLIARNVIHFTDLPQAAQKRLNERQSMRQKTQLSSLLDETIGII